MKRVNEAAEERKRRMDSRKQNVRSATSGKAGYTQNVLTSVSLTNAHSHVHPRAQRYKTIITSPGKLMERQIKN